MTADTSMIVSALEWLEQQTSGDEQVSQVNH